MIEMKKKVVIMIVVLIITTGSLCIAGLYCFSHFLLIHQPSSKK